MKRLPRIRSDHRVYLAVLATAAPGTLLALVLLWIWPAPAGLRWSASIILVVLALAGASIVSRYFARPLQTLANILAALRIGDLSVRVRGARPEDPAGLAFVELNRLAEKLRATRFGDLESEALLRAVLAEVEVAIVAVDDREVIRFMNRSAEVLLGHTLEQNEQLTAEEAGIADLLTAPAPSTVERTFLGRAGRWDLRRGSFRQEGRPHRLLVLSDVSRVLREEEREAWRRLVRVLSHEINNSLTPIRSISGSLLDLMRQDPPPTDRDSDLGQGLQVIATRSESLARFMTSYARLTRLPPPDRSSMDVGQWVRRVVALETRRPVRVVEGPSVTVRADADQLDQLLINLLRNAVEASEETDGAVTVGWEREGDNVAVWVRDEGHGLSTTENLFVPFFTTKRGGSGIGLALSRQIVEAHDGHVLLANRNDGSGCEARVTLRRASD
jgi:two-component system, NtrC family, nitrogen regulation sensor histidine kinase NtrY